MESRKKQIKHSLIYFIAMIANRLMPFLAFMVFTRILTKEDYGLLALAEVYAILASGLVHFGMIIVYDRNYFEYKNSKLETGQLLFSTIAFVFFNFLILGILTWCFQGALAQVLLQNPAESSILFWCFCAQFLGDVNYNYYFAYFKNSEEAGNYTSFTIVSGFLNFILGFFFVAGLRIGVIGLIYAQLLANLGVFLYLTVRLSRILPIAFNFKILMSSIRLGVPLLPTIILSVLSKNFNKIILSFLSTLGGVGIFSIGQKVASLTFEVMTTLQNVFSPRMYTKMFDLKEDGKAAVGVYLTPFAYVSVLAGLLIALFSEEIFYVLTPSSYHGAIDIVIVLSMYFGFLFFGKINSVQIVYAKKTFILTLLSAVGIFVNIGLSILMIRIWGALGAAWATFLAALISGYLHFVVSQKYYEIKWQFKELGIIFGLFFSASLALLMCRHFHVSYWGNLGAKSLALVLYGFYGFRIGVFSPTNLQLVRDILISRKTAK